MSDTVTITREEYDRLLRDSHILFALQDIDVDALKWCGSPFTTSGPPKMLEAKRNDIDA